MAVNPALIKAAITLATDKRTWIVVGSIIFGVLFMIVGIVAAFLNIFSFDDSGSSNASAAYVRFVDDMKYTYPLKRFTSEIKFLQPGETNTTTLTKYKEVVWLPEKTADATTYTGDHKVYNNGLFDYLIDVYKDEINNSALITLRDDIVSVDEVQDRAWWLSRKQQKEIIQNCLNKDCGQREREIEQWLIDKMKNNAQYLFNYILT